MQNCPDDSPFLENANESPHVAKIPDKSKNFGANAPVEKSQIAQLRGRVNPSPAVFARPLNPDRPRPERPRHARVQNTILTDVLEDYWQDYLDDAEYHGQSILTRRGKKEAIGKLLWFLAASKTPRCGPLEVKRFLSHVQNGHLEPSGRFGSRSARSYKPVGDRAIQLYFVYIKGYFNWLFDERVIESNPLLGVKQPKCAKPKIHPFTIEEIALLLGAIRKIHNHARNEAIIYFLLDTGVRVAEMCGILAGDIDLARGVVTVTGKGNKKREVWFGRDTAAVLKKYLSKHPRERDETLFYSERPRNYGDGITTDGVRRLLSRWGKLAGLSGKRVSPHTFRHTFASEFIKSGGMPKALQMMLGHEDMEMTYRYVSLSETDAAAQHRQHSPARLLRARHRK